nr:AGE family epimerase/isomerase [uncultured Brevundimonas sp.]
MTNFYPVIMCGGAGTRLWPASRPSRPKQFLPLSGNRSLFQETALRVAPLASGDAVMLVIGGVSHRDFILNQLEQVGLTAQVLLEPEARDSAAAMAAAAAWTIREDPSGVNVFVASDHHIPDAEAFQSAVRQAGSAATEGRIVTLGVKPRSPTSAYGYIAPSGAGLSNVKAFVEKPDAEAARHYVEEGYLWNSGNFVVSAQTLIDELRSSASAVEAAVQAALPIQTGRAVATLGASFGSAPKISIDYAVMERTRLASVLPVDFDWSDLGAWDSVAATGEGDVGSHVFEDAENCLVRAPDGVMVAAVGVKNLAVVVEDDAVLVCDLARSQDVKKVVERLKITSPQHLDFGPAATESLPDGAGRMARWLRQAALPLWGTLGQDEDGGFRELIGFDGLPVASVRRARVQPRQIHVFSEAGRLGWRGPWKRAVALGLQRLNEGYVRDDGRLRATLSEEGQPLDERAKVYDQAFLLFALAACADIEACEQRAIDLRDKLLSDVDAMGGFIEQDERPYQSNPHMHLLEACLAWEAAGADKGWTALADRLVDLASRCFIDADGGFVREFFDANWSPAEGDDGSLAEPGHQFEWAWLLARYAAARQNDGAMHMARRLYDFGLKGVEPRRQVAVDALNADGSIRSLRARLWPQTEWLKAALILAEHADDGERARYLRDAARAQRAIWLYLTPEGLWHDKCLATGEFIDEPAPASSFYHIMGAFSQLRSSLPVLYPNDLLDLRLG